MEVIIIFVLSIILFYGAFKIGERTNKILENGIEVEGVVFDFNKSNFFQSNAKYPVIRFLTSEKEWITQEYNMGSAPILFKKGQKVSVIYNPNNPKDFIIKAASNVTGPLIIKIIATILLGIGIYKLYVQF